MTATKINRHGELTRSTKDAAFRFAEKAARYKHGEWFVWMHKSGEWKLTRALRSAYGTLVKVWRNQDG